MSAARCQRHGCGQLLRSETDALGRVHWVCDPCARNRMRICRDCPAATTDSRALRCPSCRKKHLDAQRRRNEAKRWEDPEWAARRRAQQREYNQRPEVKARKAVYKRDWVKRDPTYMVVAARKYRATEKGRAAQRRHNRKWAKRHAEQVRAYKRAYYAQNREVIRARQNARQREQRAAQRRSA